MKVAVIGSRDFEALELVVDFVDHLPGGTIVVTGLARGVDRVAKEAADRRGLQTIDVPGDWISLGVRAGLERNGEVVGQADEVSAFLAPCRQAKCAVGRCEGDGWSHGTMDAIRKALAAGKELRVTWEDGHSNTYGPGAGIPDFGVIG